jgi:hypothetical protein
MRKIFCPETDVMAGSRGGGGMGQVQQEALPVPLATDGPPMSGSGVCGQGEFAPLR